MKQIDLEPGAYRESGRQRLVRSILHKPVFMTISTVLGVWVAIAWGAAQVYDGFGRVPSEVAVLLFPSFPVAAAFFIFAALVDQDPVAEAPTSSKSPSRRVEPPAQQSADRGPTASQGSNRLK